MLKTIQVILSANATSFVAQMRTAGAAVNQFGDEAVGMATRTDAASRRTLDAVGKLSLAMGAGLAVAFGASVVAAANFDRELHNVASISDEVRTHFDRTASALVDMSRVLPQSATTLAKGLYDIASSGFQGAEGMSVLKSSAMAASAGLTTTEVAARGITAVLNAYGKSGFEAARVSDILFQTVNVGVVTFEELASTLGDFVGTAAQLGVPIEDASAALATMTLSGVSASEAGTSLNRVMIALINPSEAMTATLKTQGYESGVAAVQTLGLKGTMDMLREATGGNIVALQALFPEIRGLRGALALMANDGETYARVASSITDETARMGATQRAFNEQSKSFSFQLELAKNNLSAVGIEIGRMVLPALTDLARLIGGVAAGFSDMPNSVQMSIAGLAALVSTLASVGGAFVLLAPKIQAARDLWASLSAESPMLAAGLSSVGFAAGVVGVALAGLAAYYAIVGGETRRFNAIVDALVEGLKAEASGLKGAADAALQAELVQAGLIGKAADLGISYRTLTDAVRGHESALQAVGVETGKVTGTISSTTGAMGALHAGTVTATQSNNQFVAGVIDLRNAFAAASAKVKQQEDQTAALMQVTGKTKKELVDMGLATESTGDKIAAQAEQIGLTTRQLERFGISSEDAAKAFVKSVTDIMEATQKAFVKDFDVVAQFSASGWAKMQKDAETGAQAIVTAEGRLADARQAQAELQDRLHEKDTLSVSDHQQLAHAADKVTEAEQALAKAHEEAGSSLGTLSEEVAKFYGESITEAEKFTAGITKAIEIGLDPSIVSRLLQEGPKQAAPILQEIQSSHGAALVALMNESEGKLAEMSTLAVETARLTGLAVSSNSGQMVQDLKVAMDIAQREAATGGKLTMDALAFEMNLGYGEIKRIVDEFGIVVPATLGTAGQHGASQFGMGLAPIAPDAEALVRAVDQHFKDYIGPLPPYTRMEADQIATMWKLGTDPLPGDTGAVMYLIDEKIRGTLAALPGFTDQTVKQLESFWATGLDPMPGDTDARAQGTATMLHNALDPLPGDARNISYNMVTAWLNELAKGEGGTSEQTAAWARAMLDVLNPMLSGVGASPIQLGGSSDVTGDTDRGYNMYAEGGIREAHEAQIAPAGAMRLWAEPETGGEAYIPLAAAKRGRSVDILRKVAGRFGLVLVEEAYGGILDDLGLPMPPTLGEYGDWVGNTGERGDNFTYDAIHAWVEQKKKEAEAAAGGGAPYTGGDIGSGWQQITGYLDSKGVEYIVTSTTGGGHVAGSLHYQGKAVDLVGSGNWSMAGIFKTLGAGDPVPGINELFYDPMGYYYDEGNRYGGAIGGHEDHVHAATFDRGGILWPGLTLAYNGTGRPELVARFANGGLYGPGYVDGYPTTWTGSALFDRLGATVRGGDGASAPYPGGGGNLGGFLERTAYRLATGQDAVYDDNVNGRPDAWENAPPGFAMGAVTGGSSTSIDASVNIAPNAVNVEVRVSPGASENVIEAAVARALGPALQDVIDRVTMQARSRIRV